MALSSISSICHVTALRLRLRVTIALYFAGANGWYRRCDLACNDYTHIAANSSLDRAMRQCQDDVNCPGVVDFSGNGGGGQAACRPGAIFISWPGACVERKEVDEGSQYQEAHPYGASASALPNATLRHGGQSNVTRDFVDNDQKAGGNDTQHENSMSRAGEEAEEHGRNESRHKRSMSREGVEVSGDFCPRGIGAAARWPNLRDNLFVAHPKVYHFAIPIGCVSFVITLAVAIPHICSLCTESTDTFLKHRARQLRIVAAVPFVVGMFKVWAILAPRTWKMLFLVAAFYEVFAFWTFLHLMLGFVTRQPQKLIDTLMKGHPPRMWAVPPFGCCCKHLATPAYPCERDLMVIRLLMWQFIFVIPSVAAAEMSESLSEKLDAHLSKLETLSLMLAMYGLFALLEATHEMLSDRWCHAKFWTVKGTFIANSAIFRICCGVIHSDVRIGNECYTSQTLAAAAAGAATAILAMLLTVLSRYAYHPDDIMHGTNAETGASASTEMSTALNA